MTGSIYDSEKDTYFSYLKLTLAHSDPILSVYVSWITMYALSIYGAI